MNEDEPMTPDEIRNAAIDEIILGLKCAKIIITRKDVIDAATDEQLREQLRGQIESAHQVSDKVEQHSPGKNLSNLVVMYKLDLITFED